MNSRLKCPDRIAGKVQNRACVPWIL